MTTRYLTTPIYYANGNPHLGHLYTTTVADVLALHWKQCGDDTLFLTGTDEHGVNIQRAAEAAGRSPKEQVDLISRKFKETFDSFGLNRHDIFMRTTDEKHVRGAQALWLKIAEGNTPRGNPNIYKGHYEGWFCAPCAAFKSDDELTVPDGGGTPLCVDHERPVDRVSEESYFFRLSDYQERLIDILENQPERIQPEARRNEVLSFVRGGLQDLSISRETRSVSWGIPVPGDSSHVMYVWLDALSNYITALGYGTGEDASFRKYWSAAVHLVGKDILRFHTVYWWSFLIAAGIDLPRQVFSHGMWLDSKGRKMGKTLGNVVELDDLGRRFPVETIRYFLLREMVFGQDGNFGYQNLLERANADLANGLGNLAARTISMIQKYRDGVVPSSDALNIAVVFPDFENTLCTSRDTFVSSFGKFQFSHGIDAAWGIVRRADLCISENKPWLLAKDAERNAELDAVLRAAWESLRWIVTMAYPIMPESCARLSNLLGFEIGSPMELTLDSAMSANVSEESEIVFPRLDKELIMSETEKEPEKTEASVIVADADAAPEKEFITIDDFLKVELRIGEVKVAERIPNADKLLRFEIDLGEGRNRQILAGLAEYYEPETLIGRKVVVVANLKPRKMRGLESEGMICAASLEDSDDKPAIATFLESVSIGARLK
jgi:methionyl-tRNA synthetase